MYETCCMNTRLCIRNHVFLFYFFFKRYDPRTGVWTAVAPMKTQRGGVAAIGFGDYLYAAGGNNGGNSLSSVERYDAHRDVWSDVTAMSQQRAGVCRLPSIASELYM